MQDHNVAACQSPDCEFCTGYGTGYAQGKAKAWAEMAEGIAQAKRGGCSCLPCQSSDYLKLLERRNGKHPRHL